MMPMGKWRYSSFISNFLKILNVQFECFTGLSEHVPKFEDFTEIRIEVLVPHMLQSISKVQKPSN